MLILAGLLLLAAGATLLVRGARLAQVADRPGRHRMSGYRPE
jgi:hypothetical protein